jgi:hypothetical protein
MLCVGSVEPDDRCRAWRPFGLAASLERGLDSAGDCSRYCSIGHRATAHERFVLAGPITTPAAHIPLGSAV